MCTNDNHQTNNWKTASLSSEVNISYIVMIYLKPLLRARFSNYSIIEARKTDLWVKQVTFIWCRKGVGSDRLGCNVHKPFKQLLPRRTWVPTENSSFLLEGFWIIVLAREHILFSGFRIILLRIRLYIYRMYHQAGSIMCVEGCGLRARKTWPFHYRIIWG